MRQMRPTTRDLCNALILIGQLLGADRADYCFEGRFRFELGGDWSLVISADDAGRFRLDACLRSRVRCTLWCLADDRVRLAALIVGAQQEAAALAA
jgi:hypothetical protein